MCFHLYADDTQFYEACRMKDLPSLVSSTSHCISDVKIWMNSNKLKLNDDKTEFIIIGSNTKKLPKATININGYIIISNKKVKNLAVIL